MSERIERLAGWPLDSLRGLIDESVSEEHRFLTRLESDWRSGANRFALPGEALFLARSESSERIVGVGGLNVDPYAGDPRTGRVRHLYVARDARRRGVGRRLVGAIVGAARPAFDRLRLRTRDAGAARFYEAIGFTRSAESADATHLLDLR